MGQADKPASPVYSNENGEERVSVSGPSRDETLKKGEEKKQGKVSPWFVKKGKNVERNWAMLCVNKYGPSDSPL